MQSLCVCLCCNDVGGVECTSTEVLMDLAKSGKVDLLDRCLRMRAINYNVTDADGFTPLMWASYYGHLYFVKCLLHDEFGSFKVYVNITDNNGYTALMHASDCGHVDIVRYLLNARNLNPTLDIHIKNKNGDTALMCASTRGFFAIKFLLLFHSPVIKIDLNPRAGYTVTALMLASNGTSDHFDSDEKYSSLSTAYHNDEIPTFKLLALHQVTSGYRINEIYFRKQAEFIRNVIPRYQLFLSNRSINQYVPIERARAVDRFLLGENKVLREFCDETRRSEVVSGLDGKMPVVALAGLISQYDNDFHSFPIDDILNCNSEIKKEADRKIQAVLTDRKARIAPAIPLNRVAAPLMLEWNNE